MLQARQSSLPERANVLSQPANGVAAPQPQTRRSFLRLVRNPEMRPPRIDVAMMVRQVLDSHLAIYGEPAQLRPLSREEGLANSRPFMIGSVVLDAREPATYFTPQPNAASFSPPPVETPLTLVK